MKNSTNKINKLRALAEASLDKTTQMQQSIAQLEANLLRRENQKVSEKSEKN